MLYRIRSFFETPLYSLMVFAIGVYGAVSGQTMLTLEILAVLIEILLFVCRDIMPTTLPFMMLMAVGASLSGDFSVLLPYWPWAMPAVVGVIFHYIVYRKPLKIGKTFWALLAVTGAVLLGGLGIATREQYLNPLNLVYVFALGAGLMGMYCLYATEYREEKNYDVGSNLLFSMLLTGLVCALYYFFPLFKNLEAVMNPDTVNEYLQIISYRNSMANYLIMMLPAPFYFASRQTLPKVGRVLSFLCGLVLYTALLISMARTALVFGTVLFLVCLVVYFAGKRDWSVKAINLAIVLCGMAAIWLLFREEVINLWSSRLQGTGGLFHDSARSKLIRQSVSDFLANPLFGVGLLGTYDPATFTPPPGNLYWFHSYFPQVIGSMGIVGILAFGYQLFERTRLMLFKPNRQTTALSLSYLGLFLYSQTDPGEFEPIPFSILAILIFVLLEKHREDCAQAR